MKILVCVPTYKRPKTLAKVDKALIEQTDNLFDVVYIGNLGGFKPKRFPSRKIHNNCSFVEALNMGLTLAKVEKYDWIIYFDDDSIPHNKYISTFKSFIKPDFVCIGGPTKNPSELSSQNVPSVHWDGSVSGSLDKFDSDRHVELVGHLQGCNWSINVQIARDNDVSFDYGLSRVGFRSETDFQVRMKKLKYSGYLMIIWSRDLWVDHLNEKSGSFSEFEQDNYWRGYDHARFAIKNFGVIPALFGILFSWNHPKGMIFGVPLHILKKREYLSWYEGWLDYFEKNLLGDI